MAHAIGDPLTKVKEAIFLQMKTFTLIAFLVGIALSSTACGDSDSQEPTATPRPTRVARPTPTLEALPTVSSQDSLSKAGTATTEGMPTPIPAVGQPAFETLVGQAAPELVGISNWINTSPFTLKDFLGKVVLIDFWTYTCVNCIRTLPILKEWDDKYSTSGLVVIGLHSPEFEFEKDAANVEKAVADFGITYPTLQDNQMATWKAYRNQAWPAKYLIDKDGIIRYSHFGEGAYDETEDEIRRLLKEAGADVGLIEDGDIIGGTYHKGAFVEDPELQLTRELYTGLERNFTGLQFEGLPYVLHREYFENPDSDVLYVDEASEHLNQFIYLEGLWHNHLESLQHARKTENYEDYILVNFRASEVNVVLTVQENAEPYEVRVLVDDAPVARQFAGADIRYDEQENSFMLVDQDRMYAVLSFPEFEGHELKLSSNSDSFSVFAYTFGAYTELHDIP